MSFEDKSGASFNHKKFLAFAFVFVLIIIGFFTFFNDLSFTGNLIGGDNSNESSLEIRGNLSVIPPLSLNSDFEEIRIFADSGNYVVIENLDLDLRDNSEVILKNFDGKIDFDGNSISRFKGEADDVIVNGESLSSREGKTKVELDEGFSYSGLEIKGDLFLRKLEYVTSGNLVLNERKAFKLYNENLEIRNFYGSIFLRENNFGLEGVIDRLEIEGGSKISIS